MSLIGDIEGKLDAKGRVFLPTAFRKLIWSGTSEEEQTLILRRDIYDPCLSLYPLDVWNATVEHLTSRLDLYNPKHHRLLRAYMAGAERVSLDANGRILISKRLLQSAGLKDRVRFIGMNTRIDLWDASSMDNPFMDAEEMTKMMSEILV